MSRPYPFPVKRGSAWLSSDDITNLIDIDSLVSVSPDWEAFTPTGSWISNTTYTGQYKIIGDLMLARIKVALAGAPNSTSDDSDVAENQFSIKGYGVIYDAAPATYDASVVVQDSSSIRILAKGAGASYVTLASVTQAVPITFASGDWVSVQFFARALST